MELARWRAAQVEAVASEYHDQACAEAARQCGVGYAPLSPAAGLNGRDRDFTYVLPTKFSDRRVPACR